MAQLSSASPPLYTIPIAQRPPHGPLFSKVVFPILFNLGQLGINSAQFCALPLLLVPFVGRRAFRAAIDWTKDGFGRLLIAITVLFAPTSLVITTSGTPALESLVERDGTGRVTKVNLPDRLVIMANHQAYTDWMYLWILSCYCGEARGIIILLKASLKNIPVVGWGMFIFLRRNWGSDRANLTRSLVDLGKQANAAGSPKLAESKETTTLLVKKRRSPLWLMIFPEGTITSDEERAKSLRYAEREGVPDFTTVLHPRSTGLLFCLRTLLPQVPDIKLMDVTIGYPGVPLGKYPQEWYGLLSIFFNSVPPPTVHMHLHLYSDLTSATCPIPSLISQSAHANPNCPPEDAGLASPDEAKAFELWLRAAWTEKEKRMIGFAANQTFEGVGGEERIPIVQQSWKDWIAAFGGGGLGTLAVGAVTIWGIVVAATS